MADVKTKRLLYVVENPLTSTPNPLPKTGEEPLIVGMNFRHEIPEIHTT